MLKDMRYPFIEYMSYTLKKIWKKRNKIFKSFRGNSRKTRNDSIRSNTKRTL